MILAFTPIINNRPTFFKEKILSGSKIHTIRKGEKWNAGDSIHMVYGRGTSNPVQFNTDRPDLQSVVSVQRFEIIRVHIQDYDKNDNTQFVFHVDDFGVLVMFCVQIKIDGQLIKSETLHELTINDGFENPIQFLEWLEYDRYIGQIVHWTKKKY